MFSHIEFDTEEEAEEYRVSNHCHTTINFSEKTSKYYLVKSNVLSEIIEQSIEDTVKYLEIEVKLGFEFEVGRNWADCH